MECRCNFTSWVLHCWIWWCWTFLLLQRSKTCVPYQQNIKQNTCTTNKTEQIKHTDYQAKLCKVDLHHITRLRFPTRFRTVHCQLRKYYHASQPFVFRHFWYSAFKGRFSRRQHLFLDSCIAGIKHLRDEGNENCVRRCYKTIIWESHIRASKLPVEASYIVKIFFNKYTE